MAEDTNAQPPVIAIALAVISALTAIAVAIITNLPVATDAIGKRSSVAEASTTPASEPASINTPTSQSKIAPINQDPLNPSVSTVDKSTLSKDINQSKSLEELSQQPLPKDSKSEVDLNSASELNSVPTERSIKNPVPVDISKTESKPTPGPILQTKVEAAVETVPQAPSQLTIKHTQHGTGRTPHTDSYVAYKAWGGSNWRAWIYDNNQFKHQQQQVVTSHNDVIINYISWDGSEWTATVDAQRKVFTHTRRGATTSHEDTILNYLTWDGTQWTMSLQ